MVTITISGPVMSGKNTIAVIIQRALHAHGIIVKSSEPEFTPLAGEELVQKLLDSPHKPVVQMRKAQTNRESLSK